MKHMKKKRYENIGEFCEDFSDTYECLDENNNVVSVIVKYEEAKEIISYLCMFNYSVCSIEIEPPEYSRYNDEYIISLLDDEIYCKKYKRNGKYIYTDAEYVYVLDNCNSKCLQHIESDVCYEVSVKDEEDFDYEEVFEDEICEENGFDLSDDSDMHGFTMSKNTDDGYTSLSFYSTDKLYACELKHLMDIFGV